ncbi:MAG: DUF1737 domain-containing protein [Ruegeria sp.]
MALLYRLLTEEDTSAFCHKVSEAIAEGWELHGSPSYAFDPSQNVMRCAQAVTKTVEADYSAEMKLGQQ